MDIKITNKILSIPPHISTKWENIQSISMEDKTLHVILGDGSVVEIPNLSEEIISKVFQTHAEVLEKEEMQPPQTHTHNINPQQFAEMGDNLFQIGFAAVDELGTVMQHNPAQANAPDLPANVLEKIGTLVKAMAPEDVSQLPQAEPDCNCMHCQIARAIIAELDPEAIQEQELIEEEVTEADLTFQQWNISQKADKMFTVTNKLDPAEHYDVYLGTPVGCTCGGKNCEHIVAVLKS